MKIINIILFVFVLQFPFVSNAQSISTNGLVVKKDYLHYGVYNCDKGNITYNTNYKTNQSVAFSQAQSISEDATLDVYHQ